MKAISSSSHSDSCCDFDFSLINGFCCQDRLSKSMKGTCTVKYEKTCKNCGMRSTILSQANKKGEDFLFFFVNTIFAGK